MKVSLIKEKAVCEKEGVLWGICTAPTTTPGWDWKYMKYKW